MSHFEKALIYSALGMALSICTTLGFDFHQTYNWSGGAVTNLMGVASPPLKAYVFLAVVWNAVLLSVSMTALAIFHLLMGFREERG